MAIDPLGGGVSQCTTTTPVVKSVPSRTMPVPETPEASDSRRRMKVRMPEGARSRSVVRRPPIRRSPARRSTTGFMRPPPHRVLNSPPILLRILLAGCPWLTDSRADRPTRRCSCVLWAVPNKDGGLPDDEGAPHVLGVWVADELVGTGGLGRHGVGGLARPADDLALEEVLVAIGGVVDRHVVAPGQVPVVELDRERLLGRSGQAVLVELLVVGPDRQRGAVGCARCRLRLRAGGRAADRRPGQTGQGRQERADDDPATNSHPTPPPKARPQRLQADVTAADRFL